MLLDGQIRFLVSISVGDSGWTVNTICKVSYSIRHDLFCPFYLRLRDVFIYKILLDLN